MVFIDSVTTTRMCGGQRPLLRRLTAQARDIQHKIHELPHHEKQRLLAYMYVH
jgi:hypothetical protein